RRAPDATLRNRADVDSLPSPTARDQRPIRQEDSGQKSIAPLLTRPDGIRTVRLDLVREPAGRCRRPGTHHPVRRAPMKRLQSVPGKLAAVITTLAVAGTLTVAAPAPAAAATIDPDTWYEIVARHSGKAVEVSGGSTADGAMVQQWTRHGGANQQFRFVASGGGYYRILARHSGKVLDVFGWNPANGAEIRQWPDLNGTNQQFQVLDSAD